MRIRKKYIDFLRQVFPVWPLGLVFLLAACLLSTIAAIRNLPVGKHPVLKLRMSVDQGSSAILMERASDGGGYKKQSVNVVSFKPSEGMVEKSFQIHTPNSFDFHLVPTRKPGSIVIEQVQILGPLGTRLAVVPLDELKVISGLGKYEIIGGRLHLDALALEGDSKKAMPLLGIKRDFREGSDFESKFKQWVYFLLLFLGVPASLISLYALLASCRMRRASFSNEQESLAEAPSATSPIWTYSIIMILSGLVLIFTLHVLGFSRYGGRLAFAVTYDDVSYYIDGASRLQEAYQGSGFFGFLSSIWTDSPHSLASTLLASGAFVLFGFVDWAPYAVNFIVALGFVLFGWRLMNGASLWLKFCGMVYLFSSPMLFASVHEFRPDILCGLLTAAGVLCLLRSACDGRISLKLALGAGILLGLAVLTKPSLSPLTCILFSLSWLMVGGLSLLRRDSENGAASVLNALLVSAGAFLPLAVGWYLIDFEGVFNYIYQNQFGDHSGVWSPSMEGSVKWLYYVTGSGAIFIGKHLFVALVMWAVLVALALASGSKKALIMLIPGMLIVLFAYVFASLNPHKSGFFVAGHESLLLFIPLAGIGVLRGLKEGSVLRRGGGGIIACMMVGSVLLYSPATTVGYFWPLRHDLDYPLTRDLPENVIKVLEGELKDAGLAMGSSDGLAVFQTFTGVTGEKTFTWEAIKRGLPIKFHSDIFQNDAQLVIGDLEQYQYVLVDLSGGVFVNSQFPSAEATPEIRSFLESSEKWNSIKVFASKNGSSFVLYKKRKP